MAFRCTIANDERETLEKPRRGSSDFQGKGGAVLARYRLFCGHSPSWRVEERTEYGIKVAIACRTVTEYDS